MLKFMYELRNGQVRNRKIRGSGREAAMRAAAAAPEGTVLIAKATTRKVVVGTKVSDGFTRVASPSKSLVCIRSEKTGKTTCVDRGSFRKAKKYDEAVKDGLIPRHVARRPSEARANPIEYTGIDPRTNPIEYVPARLNPSRSRRRRRASRRLF